MTRILKGMVSLALMVVLPIVAVGILVPRVAVEFYARFGLGAWVGLGASVITVAAGATISLPCGVTGAGLPVGLQLAGPSCGEYQVIAAAYDAEQILGMSGRVPMDPITR